LSSDQFIHLSSANGEIGSAVLLPHQQNRHCGVVFEMLNQYLVKMLQTSTL